MKLRVYNKTLDQNLWNDKTLKPEIRESLLKIAEDFYNSTDLNGEIENILFLGSSANYNWTPTSDIDLHLVINIAAEKINEEYARKFMDGLASKWNTNHNIEIKGHPVEVYLQDIREPNSTPQLARPGAAIYSVFDDTWLLEPNPQNIQLDADKIRKKFQQLRGRIQDLIQTEDIKKLKSLMKFIKNYRNAGLAEGGEFSVENLVFKALRHSGDLGKLKTSINKIYDRKVSLPEDGNIQPDKKTEPLTENINKPFLIVGNVNDDLEVEGEIDFIGAVGNWSNVKVMHTQDWGINWRYKSETNTIYWGDEPVEKQKDAVLDYLHNKHNVVNPDHSYDYIEYTQQGHYVNVNVDEGLVDKSKPFTIVGIIEDDLRVDSVIDYDDTKMHYQIKASSFSKRWRYNSNKNTVYWIELKSAPSNETPTKEEQYAVELHLNKKYSIVNPHQKISSSGYFTYGHQMNFGKKLTEELIDKKAELYLGFINRTTLKVIGIDVHDESMIHAHWQRTLPKEYQWGYGTESLLWRYKRTTNTVYWWSMYESPTDDEKVAVEDWLFENVNIKYPEHRMISWDKSSVETLHRNASHSIDEPPYRDIDENIMTEKQPKFLEEVDKNANLFLGIIVRENFKVYGTSVDDDEYTHADFMFHNSIDLYDSEYVPWRYKRFTNTIYWWYPRSHPSEDEKMEVENWLHDNAGLKFGYDIEHKMIGSYSSEMMKNRVDAHTLTETVQKRKTSKIYNELVRWIFS